MRRLTWHDPMFRYRIKTPAGEAEERLAYAASEADLKIQLERLGYKIIEIAPYEFADWKKTAQDETDAVLKIGKPPKWKDHIWGSIKQYLYSISNGLCGYCEVKVLAESTGAVEHYRPKGGVDGEADHGGYYWLAYELTNYIPTCANCNTGKGKRNQFPITGKRAQTPANKLALEKPLLLHPFLDEPEQHLTVIAREGNPAFGVVGGITKRGKTSVTVYRLNRDHLLVERQHEMRDLFLKLQDRFLDPVRREQILVDIETARCAFPTAARAVLIEWIAEQKRQFTATAKRIARQGVASKRSARSSKAKRRSSRAKRRSSAKVRSRPRG